MSTLKRRYNLLVLALMTVAVAAAAQTAEPAEPAETTEATEATEAAEAAEAMPTSDSPRVTVTFGGDLDKETRALVDQGEVFAPDVERVWCMTRVEGLTPPTTVTHVWYHEGETKARVDLTVGSQNWRTWSSKKVLAAWTGRWEVKVLDADGTVIGAAAFEISEP